MSDPLKKVQSGQPLVIPASAYNAFIDAALDFRQRTAYMGQGAQPSFAQASIVLVRNDSGANRGRFEILGVNSSLIDPASNEEEFKNRLALTGVVPVAGTHEGRFVVLAEPIASGKIGRAFAAGVCVVKLFTWGTDFVPRYAEIVGGTTEYLEPTRRGSAEILWRSADTGLYWAIVRLGKPIPLHVFPVNLTLSGGSQGSEIFPASWTYDVYDIDSGNLIKASVDPTQWPHKWQRPPVGQMIPATFGYAHYEKDPYGNEQFAIGWINEMVDQEACPPYVGSGG